MVPQKLHGAEERRLHLIGVQVVQHGGRGVPGLQAQINALSADGIRVAARFFRCLRWGARLLLGLAVIRVPARHGIGGGVRELLRRQAQGGAEAGLAQPDQVAGIQPRRQVRLPHVRDGVDQVEVLCHLECRHKGHAAPLDGAGIADIALSVLGVALAQVEDQGAGAAVTVQNDRLAGAHAGDPQGLPGISGEQRGGDVQVSAGPEGHGLVRHWLDINARHHKIHCLRRPGGGGRHLEHQQHAAYQRSQPLFHDRPSSPDPLKTAFE